MAVVIKLLVFEMFFVYVVLQNIYCQLYHEGALLRLRGTMIIFMLLFIIK